MEMYLRELRIAGYSPVTVKDRMELLARFSDYVEKPLLEIGPDDIRKWQDHVSNLAPASVNVYARHLKAFYQWATRCALVDEGILEALIVPKVRRGRPHPTTYEDLVTIFSCTRGALRIAYVLAAFAGLRRGEICRMQRQHLDLHGPLATAFIIGKGGKERTVPLLKPVVSELMEYGVARAGFVVRKSGGAYKPAQLSIDSHKHLVGLGLQTTLHSMRHTFATNAVRVTKDPLFVRDLLGHESVSTTEIYMDTTANDGHLRLAGMTSLAEELLPMGPPSVPTTVPALRSVNG